METEWVPILERIKKGGFEASIITTYNAWLPFYEEVVLRHLVSSGCRHNVLVMDAGQLSESLARPESRPSMAGLAYTLIPVWAKGAFHPKVALLAAKRKGMLLVGSHNTTLSGWGLNKELTSCIAFADNDPQGIQLASHAWAFLRLWVAEAAGRLPALLTEAFLSFRQFAPWLTEPPAPVETDLRFFGTTPSGESLWSRISPFISRPVKRVTVVGPFFDGRLEFIQTVQRDLQPREIVVAVEPSTVTMPAFDPGKAGFKLVDASQVPKSSGYLHAKALYIEGDSGEKWLFTGSANPSQPAWDADPEERNVEAVLLHSGKAAEATAKKLGIAGLKALTPLATEDWKALRAQVGAERPKADRVRYLVGIAKEGCVQISKGAFPEGDFLKATAIGDHQRIIGESSNSEVTENHLSIPITGDLAALRFLDIQLKGGETCLCLVHHEDEIKRRSMSSRQAQFRKSLAALQDGNPDLENLIVAIGKIIFDEPFEIAPAARRKTSPVGGEKKDPAEDIELTSLATDLKDTKREKRRRRLVTSGDIGYLIDYLIHRLDEGLEREPPEPAVKAEPSEEEQVGADDEEPGNAPGVIDTPQLIKICNGKVKRLVSRTVLTLEQAAARREDCDKSLIKLLAVLALLRELRALDYRLKDVPPWETFVPMVERERLLKHALMYLYGREHRFLKLIDPGRNAGGWDEMSRLHGLLFWLAHDCGADLTATKGFNESPEEKRKRIDSISHMLLVTPDAVSDLEALKEARTSIDRTTPERRRPQVKSWLKTHAALGKRLALVRNKAARIENQINFAPKPGWFAFVKGEEAPTLHLVLRCGFAVDITDVCSESGARAYPAKQIAAFKLAELLPARI